MRPGQVLPRRRCRLRGHAAAAGVSRGVNAVSALASEHNPGLTGLEGDRIT